MKLERISLAIEKDLLGRFDQVLRRRQLGSTMHVHLDEKLCLEVMALRGKPSELRHFADHLIGLKGVKHGQLVISSARLWRSGKGPTS